MRHRLNHIICCSFFIRATMNEYECPEKLYKFLSVDGLLKTLESRAFRLSRPRDFNDPLDMYLQSPYGDERKAFLENLKEAFLCFIEQENDLSSLPDLPFTTANTRIATVPKEVPQDKKTYLRERLRNEPVEQLYDLKKLEQSEQDVISIVRQSFELDGIFCSTANFENLLMWAHYADKHRGAVIEFTPNKEKDSVFLASRKIAYSDERPVLYATAREMVLHKFTMSANESAKAFLEKLIQTKGSDWKYEQEYRLYVPSCIKPGREFATLEYHPEELTSVFLGCRMCREKAEMIMALAKRINPSAAIYKAYPKPREFGLSFEKLS
jgi:hypothetical protein